MVLAKMYAKQSAQPVSVKDGWIYKEITEVTGAGNGWTDTQMIGKG